MDVEHLPLARVHRITVALESPRPVEDDRLPDLPLLLHGALLDRLEGALRLLCILACIALSIKVWAAAELARQQHRWLATL